MYFVYFFIVFYICLKDRGIHTCQQYSKAHKDIDFEECFKYRHTTNYSNYVESDIEKYNKMKAVHTMSTINTHVNIPEYQNRRLSIPFKEHIYHARCISEDNRRINVTMASNENNQNYELFIIEIYGSKYYENTWDCIFLTDQKVRRPNKHITKYCYYKDGSQIMHYFKAKHIALKITVTGTTTTNTPKELDIYTVEPLSTSGVTEDAFTSEQHRDGPKSYALLFWSIGGGVTILMIIFLTVSLACKKTTADSKKYETFESPSTDSQDPPFPAGLENVYLKPTDQEDTYTLPFQPNLEEMYTKPIPRADRIDPKPLYTNVVPKVENTNLKYQNSTQGVIETANAYASIGVTGIDVRGERDTYINVFDCETYYNTKG